MPTVPANILREIASLSINPTKQTAQIIGELDRPIYEAVNEILTRLGGKWTKKVKAHQFPYDPTPLIKAVLKTREMPPKNPTAFFPTPQDVIEEMFQHAPLSEYTDGVRVLEPSAGLGAIADHIRAVAPGAVIDVCEFLPINKSVLEGKGYNVVAEDFLSYESTGEYDVVLMNPPFSVEGDKLAFITHFNHAWNMLREGGFMACVVPSSWLWRTSPKPIADFRTLVFEHLSYIRIAAGVFKESGTMIDTVIVWGDKTAQPWKRQPFSGHGSWHVHEMSLYLDNDAKVQKDAYQAAKGGRESMRALTDRVLDMMRKEYELSINLTDSDLDELVVLFTEEA